MVGYIEDICFLYGIYLACRKIISLFENRCRDSTLGKSQTTICGNFLKIIGVVFVMELDNYYLLIFCAVIIIITIIIQL